MNSLRIDILPDYLQREMKDFYEYLISKYHIEKKNRILKLNVLMP